MRVLALETSGRVGSIALLEHSGGDCTTVTERRLPSAERTARSLLPTVQQALRDHSWSPKDVGLVAVATGPGSFTGLRIGVVAAKAFAYATGAQVAGVHTLAAIAAGVEGSTGRLWTVLDAQRQELFVASFEGDRPIADQAIGATEILSWPAWIERLRPGDTVGGPPLANPRVTMPAGVNVMDESAWTPSAASVGRLGAAMVERGGVTEPMELVPHYFRKSAAEEKAEAAME